MNNHPPLPIPKCKSRHELSLLQSIAMERLLALRGAHMIDWSKVFPSDLPIGTHFWAEMDGKIVMMGKFKENEYSVCGPWECDINEKDFTILEVIDLPKGFGADKLYYL